MRSEKSYKLTTELEVLQSLDRKMDQVIKLLAIAAVRDKEQIDQIRTLHQLGLSSPDIAGYLGITAGGVRMALSRNKNKSDKKDKNGKSR